jgi:hypothetical protein
MAKHKHADLLIAYANDDSLQIQYRHDDAAEWVACVGSPSFSTLLQWRIKPTPKRAFVYMVNHTHSEYWYPQTFTRHDDADNARKSALSFNYTVTDIKEVEWE